jgi:EAL domain-containing protein (putative c-di-GMP-specific phosphodiesterase class I)
MLPRQELHVHYQPIVALRDHRLCGFEALARWRHPTRGMVPPSEFIPIAEDTGLIVQIGAWMLDTACRQMRRWLDEFPDHPDLVMNVNLSSRQIMQPDLVRTVADTLERAGLPARHLKLEITETVVLDNSETVVAVLNDLRALGVQLGLDDFGMGYSALSYLQRFPFQTLKIDRSFVNGLHESGNTEIIRAIVSLASGLAMDVTAEGVETADQLEGLRRLACEFGQGYYFYRPLEPADAEAVLRAGASEILAPVVDEAG